MLSDTPIPTFPRQGGGAHRCPELSPIQAIPHFKDFAPLVGNELRIYFKFVSDPSSYFDLPGILRSNAREFTTQNPQLVTYNFNAHRCSRGDGEATFRDCMLNYTFTETGTIFPWDSAYDVMTLNAGGAEGRKQAGGWASWSQLWPAVASGATGASGSFDVSDVGTTNFPEIECTYSNQTHSCVEYTEYPSCRILNMNVPGFISGRFNRIR